MTNGDLSVGKNHGSVVEKGRNEWGFGWPILRRILDG
jgi:hypothetical protein